MNFFPNLQVHFHMNLFTPPDNQTARTVRENTSSPTEDSRANPLVNVIASMIRQSLTSANTTTTGDESAPRSLNDIHFYVNVDSQSGLSVQELNEFTRLRLSNDNDAAVCSICQNRILSQTIVRDIQVCHHIFHPECIDEWLIQHETCPVCRANVSSVQEEKTTN